jgi:branched-chain amino acid transport system ATP-binding protein
MSAPLLEIRGLSKRFGGLVVTNEVDLDVAPAEIHALIGPNGAGKSTLIAQIAGELAPDAGAILFEGADMGRRTQAERVRRGVARTFQTPQLLNDETVLDNVALAVQARSGHSFRFFADPRHDRALCDEAHASLEVVGLQTRAGAIVGALAHGERKQLEFAVALACRPRLVLLDEPMAGLGAGESEDMIAMLAGLKGRFAMLLVEHDMDAVFALADRISVLVYGRIIASGDEELIRNHPEVRLAYLGDGET